MIFKYKTLTVYKNVEANLDKIEEHKVSFIKDANIQSNGTLIHDEVIDPLLIEIEAENDIETRVLKSIVSSASFFLDDATGLFLDNQLTRIIFYENGTGHKTKFLNYIPQIRSNVVPFRVSLTESFMLQSLQLDRTNLTVGALLEVINIQDDSVLYSVVNTVSELYTVIEDINVTIPSGAELAVYVNDIRLDNPSVVIGLRKIWEV